MNLTLELLELGAMDLDLGLGLLWGFGLSSGRGSGLMISSGSIFEIITGKV